ncbi:hypothetical protein ACIRN4_13295 [Pimelobacter simplex]|uniref:hypothetical protein n=1 Tax=Nocardioides simplex TaxID=2045 RepID=UPI0038272553
MIPSADAALIRKGDCTADGDKIWGTFYYLNEGTSWFADYAAYTLEDSAGDQSNVTIRVEDTTGHRYFNFNSPDDRKGGNSYTKNIDRSVAKRNDPSFWLKFTPDQFGFDPSCSFRRYFTKSGD